MRTPKRYNSKMQIMTQYAIIEETLYYVKKTTKNDSQILPITRFAMGRYLN